MKKDKFINRKFLIILICILFLILFAFLIVNGFLNLNRDEKIHIAEAKDMIDQRMDSLLIEMNVFPQNIEDDLLFLSKLSSLKKVIDSRGGDSIEDLEEDFLEFLRQSTAYYQLVYIDEVGQEVVRVEFDKKSYKIISKERLQNKVDRDYFQKTIVLDERETYISQLSLNIKDREENLNYFPVMGAATPVFSKEGELRGILFFNLYADYFLEDIRRSQRDGEKVFLINKEGYYLSHPDKNKEFGFMFGKEQNNFFKDYPDISKEMLLGFNERRFESNGNIFSFKYIYPSLKEAGSSGNEEQYWILVTISEKTELEKTIKRLKIDYLYFLLFSGLIMLIIIVLVFVLIFRHSNNKSTKKRR